MSKATMVLRAAAFGLVLASAGCETADRRDSTPFASPAVQMAEARQVALQATDTATRSRRAREAGRVGEADKLRDRAIEEYREALSISRELPEAWNNLGVLLMQREDYMEAADAFTVAMGLSPVDPRPCENLGLVYFRTNWLEDSLKYYDMALERSPNYPPALRGAIRAGHLLNLADERRLEIVRRGLLIEKDEAWRSLFEREKIRIEGRLETDRRAPTRRP